MATLFPYKGSPADTLSHSSRCIVLMEQESAHWDVGVFDTDHNKFNNFSNPSALAHVVLALICNRVQQL